jgi:hypothetical protein
MPRYRSFSGGISISVTVGAEISLRVCAVDHARHQCSASNPFSQDEKGCLPAAFGYQVNSASEVKKALVVNILFTSDARSTWRAEFTR